jgi:hypothetical protein
VKECAWQVVFAHAGLSPSLRDNPDLNIYNQLDREVLAPKAGQVNYTYWADPLRAGEIDGEPVSCYLDSQSAAASLLTPRRGRRCGSNSPAGRGRSSLPRGS